ncbi:unnamed protein product, partial [Chrysoparadoxa australica]
GTWLFAVAGGAPTWGERHFTGEGVHLNFTANVTLSAPGHIDHMKTLPVVSRGDYAATDDADDGENSDEDGDGGGADLG